MREPGHALLTITVEKIEYAEYKEAYRALARKINRIQGSVFGIGLFVFFFLAVWLANRDLQAVEILVLIIILFWISFRWLRSRELREASERGNTHLPGRLTFSENGLFGETRFTESFTLWEGFQAYVETGATLVLLPASRSYSVIPKRGIDLQSLAMLRELLASKLKKL